MGWSVSRHSEPDRKLDLLDRKLCHLRGAVKRGEGSIHISNAAEKLRLAVLALIKAKRALIKEYPQRDPNGRQSQKLQEEEQRWLALSIEAIVEEHGTADTQPDAAPDPARGDGFGRIDGEQCRSVRRASLLNGTEIPLPDYRLYRGDLFLGTLTRTGSDMPWWEGNFDPAPGFVTVRPLFDRERELLDADRIDEWGMAWDELAAGSRLEPLDGREPITEFLLHIEGDGRRASWRY